MARTKTFVDLDTASKNLNMSVSAIRKRLQRGTFSGKKNAKGAWVLELTPEIMDIGRTVAGQRPIQDETSEKITEDKPEKIMHPDIALLERENARLQDTITRLLNQQDNLIKQTENEQILRRESQEQVLKLTNQLSNLSERNVNLLEDNTKLDKSQTILKKAVVQLISYVAAKKKKAG